MAKGVGFKQRRRRRGGGGMINRGREAGRGEEGAMRLGKMKRSGETYKGGEAWESVR